MWTPDVASQSGISAADVAVRTRPNIADEHVGTVHSTPDETLPWKRPLYSCSTPPFSAVCTISLCAPTFHVLSS